MLFLRDPTGHCGYPVPEQERLLAEVRTVVPDAPLFVVETKADLEPQGAGEATAKAVSRISTVSGEGVPELRSMILEEAMKPRQSQDLEAYLRGEGEHGPR